MVKTLSSILLASEMSSEEICSLVTFLEERYILTVAETGEQTLEQIHHFNFHLLIISLNLQGVDAISIIKEMHRVDPGMPVILLAELLNLNTLRLATEIGSSEILQTPLDIEVIKEVIHKYLSVKENEPIC